ncbi:hypothetical protein [Ornithinimicrobium kibberense]|uniref:hypothetical protein n=1 Tax=Ornithinimicrobium kibberense TaxID=282060 RepID=UPI00362067D6
MFAPRSRHTWTHFSSSPSTDGRSGSSAGRGRAVRSGVLMADIVPDPQRCSEVRGHQGWTTTGAGPDVP